MHNFQNHLIKQFLDQVHHEFEIVHEYHKLILEKLIFILKIN
jgi:hypothetical protein